MSEMYELIHRLCKENGTSVSAMCKDLGIAPSALSELKSGRTKSLSADKVSRIAAHFGVPAGYLLGDPDVQPLAPIYFRFGKQAQEMGLSEQDMQFALDFMADHKKRNEEDT